VQNFALPISSAGWQPRDAREEIQGVAWPTYACNDPAGLFVFGA